MPHTAPQPASRPRRSVLYLPGANPRALAKARDLPADVLIFDLEDAVAPAAKEAAREAVAAALREGGYGRRELVLRVNGAGTPWGRADLQLAAALPIHAVLLPKLETDHAAQDAALLLQARGAEPDIALWGMVETPRGVMAAPKIAAVPGMAVLVAGTNDLAKALRLRPSADRCGLTTALSAIVLAARSRGLDAIDGVFNDLNDPAGLERECRQGAQLGFDGKSLIHPGQIAAANAAFGPSPAELEQARRTIAAFDAALAEDRGVTTLDGRLIEQLHVDEARRLLALAAAIGD
ncbi:MAG TPA: CoA ester lyase [Alphaproteobacteria bacterium]|nr:CoA ester lyase [Alphaproteobacteria bacterium]